VTVPDRTSAVADSPSRAATRWIGRLVQAVGLFIVLIGFSQAAFELNGYLPRVFPSVRGHGVTTLGHPVDGTWVVMVAVMSFGLLACAGLPARPPRARWPRSAITQGLAGVLVLGVTAFGHELLNAANFIDPTEGDYCFYDSCWPMHEQTLALAAPAVAAGLALLIAALLARRVRWWLRAVVPVIVWVAALLIQHVVWSSWLLPIFERPPG